MPNGNLSRPGSRVAATCPAAPASASSARLSAGNGSFRALRAERAVPLLRWPAGNSRAEPALPAAVRSPQDPARSECSALAPRVLRLPGRGTGLFPRPARLNAGLPHQPDSRLHRRPSQALTTGATAGSHLLVLCTPWPRPVPSGITSGWHASAMPEDRLPAPASGACAIPKKRTPEPARLRPPPAPSGPGRFGRGLFQRVRNLTVLLLPFRFLCGFARFVSGSAAAGAGPEMNRPTMDVAGDPACGQRCLANVLAGPRPRRAPAGAASAPMACGSNDFGPASPASAASAG